MAKDFTKSSMKWISIILLLIICGILITTYSSDKGRILDKMTDRGGYAAPSVTSAPASVPATVMSSSQNVTAPIMPASSSNVPTTNSTDGSSTGYLMQPVANPSDLLPNDQNSQWANLNPLNGSVPIPVDLLQAGYQIGLDTIGQTLKNANYQLRSDPIIEKKDIGPWMQSTIEPDYGRVPLEIGYGCR